MKKLTFLLISILLGTFIVSCDKHSEDLNVTLKEARIQSETTPISDCKEVTPVILAVDKPKGGNVTCSDVMQAFDNEALICGDKINYDDFSTEEGFEAAFPSWLNVKVDGIYVSFNMDACAEIEGVKVKVGAVIVKGSNAASVYYYQDGTLSDCGLAAPGDKYMVSNLTFCFIPCETTKEYVIAVKSWYWKSFEAYANETWSDYKYTMSIGNSVFTTGDWCDLLGINYYPSSQEFLLTENTGTVKIEEGWPSGIHSLIVTVDLNEGMIFDFTALYVGNLEGLLNGPKTTSGCPIYSAWPFQKNIKDNTHIFTIPFEVL